MISLSCAKLPTKIWTATRLDTVVYIQYPYYGNFEKKFGWLKEMKGYG